MDSSLIDKCLNEDSYEEYVDKIINIFRLSTKDSSILLNVEIINYKATVKLSIVNNNGERKDFTDTVFKCDLSFYNNFLLLLINEMHKNTNIMTSDIIREPGQDLMTFRLITENNDLLCIEGLSEDDANNLLSLDVSLKKEENYIDNSSNGVGSVLMFLLMIGVLVVTFLLIVVFIG